MIDVTAGYDEALPGLSAAKIQIESSFRSARCRPIDTERELREPRRGAVT